MPYLMTEPPAPMPPRSKYYRDRENPPPFILQERDVDFLVWLFHARVISGAAAYLVVDSGRHWNERLTGLWQHGYLGRFQFRASAYKTVSSWPYLLIETGVASLVVERKLDPDTLTDEEWEQLRADAKPHRERLVDLLAERGLPIDRVRTLLDHNTTLALKLYTAETSQVKHDVLASTFLAYVSLHLRLKGETFAGLLPNNVGDLSFETTDKTGKKVNVPIRPDILFVTPDGQARAVEAETGQSSRAKVAEKIDRYLKLHAHGAIARVAQETGVTQITSFRVVFHCKTQRHADMVLEEIRSAVPSGTGLFLVTLASDFSLDYSFTQLRLRKRDDGTPLLPLLAAKVTEPLAYQVIGTDTVTVQKVKLEKPRLGRIGVLA